MFSGVGSRSRCVEVQGVGPSESRYAILGGEGELEHSLNSKP